MNTFQVKTGGEASELPVALIQQTVEEEEEPSRKVSFGTAVTVIGKQLIYTRANCNKGVYPQSDDSMQWGCR